MLLRETILKFIAAAAFPRLAHRLRWPTRLGPRGLLAYTAANWLGLFAIHHWVIPLFKRAAEQRARAEQELRERFGRDPTDDEVLAHLGVTRER